MPKANKSSELKCTFYSKMFLFIETSYILYQNVVRQKYTDKRLLDIPKSMMQEKRFPKLAILLNDVDYSKGYGYGYGYGYVEIRRRNVINNIIKGFLKRI